MADFLEYLEQRIENLKQIIHEKNIELSAAPEGTLHLCESRDRIQYYHKQELRAEESEQKESAKGESAKKKSSRVIRKYLKNSENKMIEALCQKDYDQKILQAAQKELIQLEKLKKNYPDVVYEDIYDRLNIHRRKLVHPIILPDEEFVREWEAVEYARKGFHKDAPDYYTDKGERVRSKTEILIANALYRYNVPYRYEESLYLNGYGTIHPDFTVLNVRLRKEYYWEHLGMMDNLEYVEDALRRITMYEKNNIFLGDKLILTYESLKTPMNSQTIHNVIQRYLL